MLWGADVIQKKVQRERAAPPHQPLIQDLRVLLRIGWMVVRGGRAKLEAGEGDLAYASRACAFDHHTHGSCPLQTELNKKAHQGRKVIWR
jgi:hypothetical protein